MLQFSKLKKVAVANHSGAMGAYTISKNRDIPKTYSSRVSVIYSITALFFLFLPFTLWGQMKVTSELSDIAKTQETLWDFFELEGIQYQKLIITSKDLGNKTYKLSVKEIWDGEITKDSTIVDTNMFPDFLKTVGDTILTLSVISKFTDEHKLKMFFRFPKFSIKKEFDAAFLDEWSPYSLRKVVGTEIVEFDKNFYLMVYMLPYIVGNSRQYCAVENSGEDIENWGKKFNIKHYLVFEMKFETL